MASPHASWASFDVPATLAEFGRAQLSSRSLRDAIVFECVGIPGMLRSLIENAPLTTHVVVVGACQENDRILPVIAINTQLRLSFVFACTPQEFADTLEALADGGIDADTFLTGTVALADPPDAFARLVTPGEKVHPARAGVAGVVLARRRVLHRGTGESAGLLWQRTCAGIAMSSRWRRLAGRSFQGK